MEGDITKHMPRITGLLYATKKPSKRSVTSCTALSHFIQYYPQPTHKYRYGGYHMIHEDFYYGNNCIEYFYRTNEFKIIGIKYSETDYEFYINDYNGSTTELDICTFVYIDEAMYFQQSIIHMYIDHIIYAANKIYNAKHPVVGGYNDNLPTLRPGDDDNT